MKAEEIRKMSEEGLEKKEKELREELGNLSFQHKLRPLEDASRLKKIKKDIARIQTVINEKVQS
ncbi:MAG: 50S ribosomal protein L29 [Desulfobacterales bacterium]|jgi:large subunit ribosomal protein L29|nr:50S ribosomal protein L29 [Deltaproteobacteria bacterium]NNK92998.1 50S ribosomal protein L29 [Desulfobacterales bacterium]